MSFNLFRQNKPHIYEIDKKRRELTGSENLKTTRTKYSSIIWQFILCFIAIILICFVGQSSSINTPVPKQIAKHKIVSEFPFNYESKITTKRLIEQKKKMANPVYKIDFSKYESFEKSFQNFREDFEELLKSEKKIVDQHDQNLISLLNKHNSKLLPLNIEDLFNLSNLSHTKLTRIFNESIFILKEIVRKGIFNDENVSNFKETNPYFIELNTDLDKSTLIQSEKIAIKTLRTNLWAMDIPYEATNSLIHIFKSGISPNVVYDTQKTSEKLQEIADSTEPVIIHVNEGTTMIESGSVVSKEDHEKLTAYYKELQRRQTNLLGSNVIFFERSFLVLFLLIFVFLAIYLTNTKIKTSNHFALLAFVVIISNLLIIRIFYTILETSFISQNNVLLSIIQYAIPIALASLILTITVDISSGLIASFLVVSINVLMQNGSFENAIILAICPLSTIYFARKTKLRENVIKASSLGGIMLGTSLLIKSLLSEDVQQFDVIGEQMAASILTGIITGIITTGILPLIEKTFRCTTDITLLEVTDYNHPLLRKLQLIAPGTYHHSLMVAHLAEKAAIEINANPLLCRCCALFHDIGKLVKPEYFIENQTEIENPHLKQNPSMSALIIKSHIKEGLLLAKSAKLPQIVLDAIEQHHGTSLIQYFYYQSLKLNANQNNGTSQVTQENIFRYDCPKPKTTEAAIIMLADAVEAASRSLKKASSQNIEELVDSIFRNKIEDQQLNDCSITLKEIKTIKQSFCMTLINMLHSRIVYPKTQDIEKQNQTAADVIKV